MAHAAESKKTKLIGIHKSSITSMAVEAINQINHLDTVTSISPGEIRHVGGGRKAIKFHDIRGGVKAKIQGQGTLQELFIYTTDPDQVKEQLQQGLGL